MQDNSIYKFIEMSEKDNRVCRTIDGYIMDKKILSSTDMNQLLEDAEDVICGYRALLYEILKEISIGSFVRK